MYLKGEESTHIMAIVLEGVGETMRSVPVPCLRQVQGKRERVLPGTSLLGSWKEEWALIPSSEPREGQSTLGK